MITCRTMFFVSTFLMYFGGVSSLRDVKLVIEPSVVTKGGTAALICLRDMQGAPLYTVKWYRGNHEFYRHTPKSEPENMLFALPGIYVDMNNSNGTQVLLRRLEFGLSGNFSCEVTADSPYFSTLTAYNKIDVVELPDKSPILKSDKDYYQSGEDFQANCTSYPSRPAANLTIFINGEPIRSSETRLLPESNLFVSTISVDLKITPEMFIGGRMRADCIATVLNAYNKSAKLDFFTDEADPKPERITFNRGTRCLKSWLLFFLLFFLPLLSAGSDDFDYDTLYYDDPEKEKYLFASLMGQ